MTGSIAQDYVLPYIGFRKPVDVSYSNFSYRNQEHGVSLKRFVSFNRSFRGTLPFVLPTIPSTE